MELEARAVAVGFSGMPILQEVNLTVRSGEMVGLIGPNGSGKTTLLRALADLRPPLAGDVRYDGRTAPQFGIRELARRIAYLAQGGGAYWAMRADSVVALGRLPHRRPFRGLSAADDAVIENAIAMADVASLRGRTMSQVSGGERMRILLARALAVEAEILLADEPTAALDPLHQIEAMELLRLITRQRRGVIVVLHDLSLAARSLGSADSIGAWRRARAGRGRPSSDRQPSGGRLSSRGDTRRARRRTVRAAVEEIATDRERCPMNCFVGVMAEIGAALARCDLAKWVAETTEAAPDDLH